ncbi:hypothetical protein [Nocardioides stalactiti]|uniref:hypothetical protein n=1 Tax=Nocardioides stalactiti TaxID=2755356 RepID=UPI00160100F2|nr:hypothetical protein [Nocardioides stalactiti]
MSRRGPKTAVLCWLPVISVVAALFVMPSSSTGAERAAPALNVTPGAGSYGGQSIVFSGDIGSGPQKVKLQRTGKLGSPWADVPDPRPGPNKGETATFSTAADGSFRFTFPAPAMNEVYFRVAAVRGAAATEAHLFKSKHQDAEVDLQETITVDVPLPRGIAVRGEAYRLRVDTVSGARGETKPALPGRKVTLEQRDGGFNWQFVVSGNLLADGTFRFDPRTPGALGTDVYRVVLENWVKNGDTVGWMPSLPYYLKVVDRPQPVRALDATPAGDGYSNLLTWNVPADPTGDRSNVVIARTSGSGAPAPTAAKPANIVATLSGAATQYNDTSVFPGSTYKYAVYTRTSDGVYSLISDAQRVTELMPNPKRGEVR